MTRTLLVAVALCACGDNKPAPQVPTLPQAGGPVAEPPPPAPAPPPPVPAGHPRNDLIPRDVLFGNPERLGVDISPDGKQLAWRAPKDGVLNVWVAPVGKLDQAKPVTSDTTRPIRN
ncbi:MAG TPA: hypothetical protein VLM79_11750, partial [Kofleriaceae bacterium]|nr:hypothetical protein [Kofleriaceae bacterium]